MSVSEQMRKQAILAINWEKISSKEHVDMLFTLIGSSIIITGGGNIELRGESVQCPPRNIYDYADVEFMIQLIGTKTKHEEHREQKKRDVYDIDHNPIPEEFLEGFPDIDRQPCDMFFSAPSLQQKIASIAEHEHIPTSTIKYLIGMVIENPDISDIHISHKDTLWISRENGIIVQRLDHTDPSQSVNILVICKDTTISIKLPGFIESNPKDRCVFSYTLANGMSRSLFASGKYIVSEASKGNRLHIPVDLLAGDGIQITDVKNIRVNTDGEYLIIHY